MRRFLATGCLAAVVAFAAACGADDDGGGDTAAPTGEPGGNTEQVCADAVQVQSQELQSLNEDLAALEQEGLEEEEFQREALSRMETTLVDISDGLHEQAGQAEDAELSEALSGLADGLSDAASQVDEETLETGQIPGADQWQAHNQTLTRMCTPQPPASPTQ